MRRRCSLCGGKLKGNICTECGLDNSKNDSNYVTGKSHGDEAGLTHVHTGQEDPFAGKTLTRQQAKEQKAAAQRRKQAGSWGTAGKKPNETEYRGASEKKSNEAGYWGTAGKKPNAAGYRAVPTNSPKRKSKAIIGIIIGIAIVLVMAIPDIVEFVTDILRDNDMYYSWESEEYDDASVSDVEEDPYMFAGELPEGGEEYEITLEPGCYKGGVHIPVGKYTVEYVQGQGDITLDDWDRSIYLYGSFGFETVDDFENADDFRVYENSLVKINGTLKLVFRSENAQMDMTYTENPNTEGGEFADDFVAGKDIPAGVYDVTVLEGKGSIEYDILLNEDSEYYSYEDVDFMVDGAREYKNLVLPEGVEVRVYGVKIRLTPSEIIESEDYEGFYPVF